MVLPNWGRLERERVTEAKQAATHRPSPRSHPSPRNHPPTCRQFGPFLCSLMLLSNGSNPLVEKCHQHQWLNISNHTIFTLARERDARVNIVKSNRKFWSQEFHSFMCRAAADAILSIFLMIVHSLAKLTKTSPLLWTDNFYGPIIFCRQITFYGQIIFMARWLFMAR